MNIDFKNFKRTYDALIIKDKYILKNLDFINKDIIKIENVHNEMKEKYKQTQKLIGLDALYFQKILLINEIKNFDDLYNIIINRLYADYYNLGKLINNFINNNIKSLPEKVNFKTIHKYNYLDLKKKYTFNDIDKIYNFVTSNLNLILNDINNKKSELNNIPDNVIYHIDNFMHSYQTDIVINEEKLKLFNDYIEYYLYLHEDYYEKLEKRINLLSSMSLHSIIDNN